MYFTTEVTEVIERTKELGESQVAIKAISADLRPFAHTPMPPCPHAPTPPAPRTSLSVAHYPYFTDHLETEPSAMADKPRSPW